MEGGGNSVFLNVDPISRGNFYILLATQIFNKLGIALEFIL
jgi:hypothetical protein